MTVSNAEEGEQQEVSQFTALVLVISAIDGVKFLDTMSKGRITARMVRRGEEELDFDRQFWKELGHEARFEAAWEMISEVAAIRGKDARQPRLQRSVQHIFRRAS